MVPSSLASLQSRGGTEVKGELSPEKGPPFPHRRTPFPSPQWQGHSPLPPLPRHGAGRGITPQACGARSRHWGEDDRRRGPEPAGPPRTPLPLPRGRRREPPGRVGKMADGPGVACHPRRRQQPAIPGPNPGWGGSDAPETLGGPSPPSAPALPRSPLHTPPSPSLSHPAQAPRADASGHPATLPRPTPTLTPARPGRSGSPRPPRRPQPMTGPYPKPCPRQASGTRRGRRQAGGRGEREAGRREAAAGERAAVAGSAPAPYTALAVEPAAPAPGEERDI